MKRLSVLLLAGLLYGAVGTGTVACGSGTGGGGAGGGTAAGGGSGGGSGGGPDVTCSATPATVKLSDLQTSMFGANCASCHYPAGYTGPPTCQAGCAVAGTGHPYQDYDTAAHTATIINRKSIYAGSGMLKIVDTSGGAGGSAGSAALANSTLWLKVSTTGANGFNGPHGEMTGLKMPNDGSMLTPQVIQQVKDWICTGAQQ